MVDAGVAVQGVLDELVGDGAELGLQIAAYLDGELVVDAWAGVADRETGRPVERETLFTVYSVSKGVTATVIHLLAERGKLAYDEPIATYWPEFGVNGKAGVTIRHALTHTAGLMRMPAGVEVLDQTDWEGMCGRIAGMAPLWAPGSQHCYHALTFGWILGGVGERADGRPLPRIVAEELVGPLGLDGLYCGVPEGAMGRVATLEEAPEFSELSPGMIPDITPPGFLADATMNRPELRRACLPGHGMVANARSLAGFYAALIGDGPGGRRLLPEARVREAAALQIEAVDANSGMLGRFGLGYSLGGDDSAAGPRVTAFGHRGYGGAYGLADPEYGLAIGFTKNYLTPTVPGVDTTWRVLQAVRAALGVPDGG